MVSVIIPVYNRRNLGLDEARGEWLAFLDADDRFYPDALETMVKKAEQDSLDMLQFAYNRDYVAGENDGRESGVITPEEYLSRGLFQGSVWSVCVRNDIVRNNGLRFDSGLRIAEDQLFIYELLRHSERVERIGNVLYWYFDNASGAYANTRPGDNMDIIGKFGPYKITSDVPAERIAELWKLADVQSCAPWKSLGVKLFWQVSKISPKLAIGLIRILRRVFPNRK